VASLLILWWPGCGGVALACRPWRFTELQFGFFGYYQARYSRDGNYVEGINQEALLTSVAASVLFTVFFAWQYHRQTSHRVPGRVSEEGVAPTCRERSHP
jgi:hypothetical protein